MLTTKRSGASRPPSGSELQEGRGGIQRGAEAFALKIAQPFMAGSSVKQPNPVPSGTKEMFARPWISFVPDRTGKIRRRFFPAMNGWAIFTSLPVLRGERLFAEMSQFGVLHSNATLTQKLNPVPFKKQESEPKRRRLIRPNQTESNWIKPNQPPAPPDKPHFILSPRIGPNRAESR
jgi:hypothetical protein